MFVDLSLGGGVDGGFVCLAERGEICAGACVSLREQEREICVKLMCFQTAWSGKCDAPQVQVCRCAEDGTES